jgi:hypothetical protein
VPCDESVGRAPCGATGPERLRVGDRRKRCRDRRADAVTMTWLLLGWASDKRKARSIRPATPSWGTTAARRSSAASSRRTAGRSRWGDGAAPQPRPETVWFEPWSVPGSNRGSPACKAVPRASTRDDRERRTAPEAASLLAEKVVRRLTAASPIVGGEIGSNFVHARCTGQGRGVAGMRNQRTARRHGELLLSGGCQPSDADLRLGRSKRRLS